VLIMVGLSLFLVSIMLVHRLGTRALRRADAWDCGHRENIPETQYTGESFSQPLRRVFGATVFAAREEVVMPPPGDDSPATHKVHMIDPVWSGIYETLGKGIGLIADQVNRLQFLTVRHYLMMMFTALVFLLLVVAVRQ
jgi:hypothetical protein